VDSDEVEGPWRARQRSDGRWCVVKDGEEIAVEPTAYHDGDTCEQRAHELARILNRRES
jgi:hypothetical protein